MHGQQDCSQKSHISPLVWIGTILDTLNVICHKYVKPSSIVVDVSKNNLRIRPEEFLGLNFQLPFKQVTRTAADSSSQGTVVTFVGVTLALPITREQWTWFETLIALK